MDLETRQRLRVVLGCQTLCQTSWGMLWSICSRADVADVVAAVCSSIILCRSGGQQMWAEGAGSADVWILALVILQMLWILALVILQMLWILCPHVLLRFHVRRLVFARTGQTYRATNRGL
jgi:hypothetical protein